MLKNKTPFPKRFFAISLRTGLISALLMAILTLIFYYTTGPASRPVLIWNHLILLFVMYFAVKNYRKKLRGYINFKECYVSGLFNGIIASIFFGIFVYIYASYIDIGLINNFISENEAAMTQYISGEELIRQKEILYKYSSPVYMGIRAMGEFTLMSLFLPLLMSVLLKREKRTEEVNESTND